MYTGPNTSDFSPDSHSVLQEFPDCSDEQEFDEQDEQELDDPDEQEFDDPDKQVREIMSSQLTVEKDITLIDRDEGIAMESFLRILVAAN